MNKKEKLILQEELTNIAQVSVEDLLSVLDEKGYGNVREILTDIFEELDYAVEHIIFADTTEEAIFRTKLGDLKYKYRRYLM